VLAVGALAPLDATVWTTPQEHATFRDLLGDGPILVLFYLFDWSST
jgi:hypothetical protein